MFKSAKKCPSFQLLISAFLLTSLFLLGISTVSASSSSSTTWDKLYGGALDDEAAAIVQTGDGGYAIAGTTYSFGAGSADFWLVKVDSSGNMQWNQTYGGPEADCAYSIVQTGDGGYAIAGQTYSFGAGNSDFWLVKVDSSGSIRWNRTYGQTTADLATSLIQTSGGGYVLAGYSTDSNASKDLWFVKTDSSGNMQWNRTYGGSGSDYANSVVQTSDGGYALAGTTSSFSDDGQADFWLVKTDSNGNVEWNKTYTKQKTDSAKSVIQTSDGGYTLAGRTTRAIVDTPDVWVINVDSGGNMEWDVTWAPTEPAITNSLIQTSDGGYAVTGWTSSLKGFPGLSSYMFLVTIDADGNMKRIKTYEGLGDNNALFVVQIEDGGYAMAGTTRSTDWGAHYDVWFAKVDASGEPVPEFPSWIILPLFLMASLVAIIVKKRMPKAVNKNIKR
ncbi:MAG: hypothetical protein IBV52_00160 [Candidatus Bathyarchaeota archaeon]